VNITKDDVVFPNLQILRRTSKTLLKKDEQDRKGACCDRYIDVMEGLFCLSTLER